MSAAVCVPTDPSVIELTDCHAPKTCSDCGDGADYYVFVTDEQANERLGVDLGHSEWPVNEFLCRDCFAEAERVSDWSELIPEGVSDGAS